MLKIFKYDKKLILLDNIAIWSLMILTNIILGLILIAGRAQIAGGTEIIIKISNYLSVASVFATIILGIIFYIFRECVQFKLYELTDIPARKIVLSRFITFFIIVFITAILGCALSSFIDIIAEKFIPQYRNATAERNLIFILTNKPTLSWLLPIAFAFMSTIVYSFILIIAAINRMVEGKILKTTLTIVITAIAVFIQFNIDRLEISALTGLDYNYYNLFFKYLPQYYAINILDIVTLICESIFVAASIIVFSLRRVRYESK